MATSVASMDPSAMTLAAIAHGQFRLKPTVTNDRSAPIINASGVSTDRIVSGSRSGSRPPSPPTLSGCTIPASIPPPAPPPPLTHFGKTETSAPSRQLNGPSLDTSALFADIRKGGRKLRHVAQTNDRSAPLVQPGASSGAGDTATLNGHGANSKGKARNPDFLTELQSKIGANVTHAEQPEKADMTDSGRNRAPAAASSPPVYTSHGLGLLPELPQSKYQGNAAHHAGCTCAGCEAIEFLQRVQREKVQPITTSNESSSERDDRAHMLLVNGRSDSRSSSVRSTELDLDVEPNNNDAQWKMLVNGTSPDRNHSPKNSGQEYAERMKVNVNDGSQSMHLNGHDRNVSITITPPTPLPTEEQWQTQHNTGGKRVLFENTNNNDKSDKTYDTPKTNSQNNDTWQTADIAPKAFTPSEPKKGMIEDDTYRFTPYLGLGGAPKPLPERKISFSHNRLDFSQPRGFLINAPPIFNGSNSTETISTQPMEVECRTYTSTTTSTFSQPLTHSKSARVIPAAAQHQTRYNDDVGIAPSLPADWGKSRDQTSAPTAHDTPPGSNKKQKGFEGVTRPLAGHVSSAKRALFDAANNKTELSEDEDGNGQGGGSKPLTAKSIIRQFEKTVASEQRNTDQTPTEDNPDALPKVGQLRSVFEMPKSASRLKQRAKSITTAAALNGNAQRSTSVSGPSTVRVQRSLDTDSIGNGIANGIGTGTGYGPTICAGGSVRWHDYGRPDVNELVSKFNQCGNVGTLRRHRPKWVSTRPALPRAAAAPSLVTGSQGDLSQTGGLSGAEWLDRVRQKQDREMIDMEREATSRAYEAIQQLHRDFRFNINLDDPNVISFRS